MKYALDGGTWYANMWENHRNSDMTFSGDTLGFYNLPGKIDTTADCVKVLNQFEKGNWKRIFKLVAGNMYRPDVYRTFENKDNGKVVTITLVIDDRKPYACILDCNLKSCQKEIKQIVDFCRKHYVSADSSEIFYNPKTQSVFLSLPDCVPEWIDDVSDKKALKYLVDHYGENDDGEAWMEDPAKTLDGVFPAFVKECLYLDESGPEPWAGYVLIGTIDAHD